MKSAQVERWRKHLQGSNVGEQIKVRLVGDMASRRSPLLEQGFFTQSLEMTFRLSWRDKPAADSSELFQVDEQTEEHTELSAALRRACALLRSGKSTLRITRPKGSTIDEMQIRYHCSGRWEILS